MLYFRERLHDVAAPNCAFGGCRKKRSPGLDSSGSGDAGNRWSGCVAQRCKEFRAIMKEIDEKRAIWQSLISQASELLMELKPADPSNRVARAIPCWIASAMISDDFSESGVAGVPARVGGHGGTPLRNRLDS